MRQIPLPIGKTLVQRYANMTITFHVVGYDEKSGHNLWEEKCRRFENNRPDYSNLIIGHEDSKQFRDVLVKMADKANNNDVLSKT